MVEREERGLMDDFYLSLTGGVVDVEKGSERVSFGYQTVSDFARNTFIAILSMHPENLKRVDSVEG